MSNSELLSTAEDAEAAALGWLLCHVHDGKRWAVQVLPLAFSKAVPCAEMAGAHVVGQARLGHPLSLKALRLLQAGAQPKGKK